MRTKCLIGCIDARGTQTPFIYCSPLTPSFRSSPVMTVRVLCTDQWVSWGGMARFQSAGWHCTVLAVSLERWLFCLFDFSTGCGVHVFLRIMSSPTTRQPNARQCRRFFVHDALCTASSIVKAFQHYFFGARLRLSRLAACIWWLAYILCYDTLLWHGAVACAVHAGTQITLLINSASPQLN